MKAVWGDIPSVIQGRSFGRSFGYEVLQKLKQFTDTVYRFWL